MSQDSSSMQFCELGHDGKCEKRRPANPDMGALTSFDMSDIDRLQSLKSEDLNVEHSAKEESSLREAEELAGRNSEHKNWGAESPKAHVKKAENPPPLPVGLVLRQPLRLDSPRTGPEWKRSSSAFSRSASLATRNSAKIKEAQAFKRAASAHPLLMRSESSGSERKSRLWAIALGVLAVVFAVVVCASVFASSSSAENAEMPSQSEAEGGALLLDGTHAAASSSSSSWGETFAKELHFQVLLDFLVGI
eukprot:2273496-Rhodomonas_salina.1